MAVNFGDAAVEISALNGIIDHNKTKNFIANEHIDWTNATDTFKTTTTGVSLMVLSSSSSADDPRITIEKTNTTDQKWGLRVQRNTGEFFIFDETAGVSRIGIDLDGTMQLGGFAPLRNNYTGGSTDGLDVTGITVRNIVTNAGNVVIGGLSGGKTNQIVWIVKNNSSNTMTIEHNEGTAVEPMLMAKSVDLVFPAGERGAVCLVKTVVNWIEISSTNL